jgi:hypothetical protein
MGWWPLETAIERFGEEFLVGKTVQVHDQTHGWGGVEHQEKGKLGWINGDEAYANFKHHTDWCGELWVFEIWINPDQKPDEVDIL